MIMDKEQYIETHKKLEKLKPILETMETLKPNQSEDFQFKDGSIYTIRRVK